jgi:hypothetical protein
MTSCPISLALSTPAWSTLQQRSTGTFGRWSPFLRAINDIGRLKQIYCGTSRSIGSRTFATAKWMRIESFAKCSRSSACFLHDRQNLRTR